MTDLHEQDDPNDGADPDHPDPLLPAGSRILDELLSAHRL